MHDQTAKIAEALDTVDAGFPNSNDIQVCVRHMRTWVDILDRSLTPALRETQSDRAVAEQNQRLMDQAMTRKDG